MKQIHAVAVVAALSMALWMPAAVRAADGSNATAGNRVAAGQMVATRAGLVTMLDAKDAKVGQEFKAKLPRKVHLKNGEELPAGTMLLGKVSSDDMNVGGKSKLVLLIDQAKLKDGKMVQVKATIVGIDRPGVESSEYYEPAGDQAPNLWHNGITSVDEIDALHHVDLHSSLKSTNSGVLVSKTDSDIKLKPGTELALAIAETGASAQSMSDSGH